MKYVLLCFCLAQADNIFSQTRDQDLDFFFGSFAINPKTSDYTFLNVNTWGFQDQKTSIFHSVNVKKIKSLDAKPRGVLMIYSQIKNTTASDTLIFCIPEKNSDPSVNKRCFDKIYQVADPELLKALVWAMIRYSSVNN